MTKDYIQITILDLIDLDIDGSSRADLCCYVKCTAWNGEAQKSKVFTNTLEPNFKAFFQIPIINFDEDVIGIEISDESNNHVSSIV